MDDQNQLKKETLKQNNPTNKKPKKKVAWGSVTVTSILAVVALVSIVQAVQSAAILEKIESGAVAPASSSSGGVTVPDNLKDLPNMVGGC